MSIAVENLPIIFLGIVGLGVIIILIGIMKLDDSLFYVTEIGFSNFERLNEILENPENYFKMEVKVNAQ